MKKNPVVHFEMPYEDGKRVSEFYEKAFGWEMKTMDATYGNYVLAETTETDENQMVKTPGTINGGFYPKSLGSDPGHIVISVDNLEESIKAVESAGGSIEGKKMDIPGVGLYVSFKDSEGNRVGMLQPVS